jgi:hypothetical protein
MVLVHESSFFKHFYPKQTLWIYFIHSNLFLLLPLMSVSVDFFLFLYFHDDLEYHCLLVTQDIFVGYDQTIANNIELTSLEFVLPKFISYMFVSDLISPCVAVYPTQHLHFNYTQLLNMLSFYNPAFCVIHHRGPNSSSCRIYLLIYLGPSYHWKYQLFVFISLIWLLFYNYHLHRSLSHSATSFSNIKMCPYLSSELSPLNWHFIY